MTETLLHAVSWLLLAGGAFFIFTGSLGVLRLPDVYARMHAAGMIDTLGATLTLAGMAVQGGWSLVTVKLFLICIFLFFTSPTATYAVANAALSQGLEPVVSSGAGLSGNAEEDGEERS